VALSACAAALARHRLERIEAEVRGREAPVEVVVAKVPIGAGSVFSTENLAKKRVPRSGTTRRNVPAGEFELLLGARAKIDIGPGEPVLWSDVEEPFEVERFSLAIPEGRRALTLAADSRAAFAGLLRPGDTVDLLCAGDGAGNGIWIRNVPVAAVDKSYGEGAAADVSEAETITLSVTPEEGRRIAAAASEGRLHWFLRNPDDRGTPVARRTTPRTPPVEIWKAGRKEQSALAAPGELP